MASKNFIYPLISIVLIAFFSCKKGTEEKSSYNFNVRGHIQKGPFIIGSTVTVYDLASDLSQTGRSFVGQIADNSGSFSINNSSLSSSSALIQANGYYYNEVANFLTTSPIILYAAAEVSASSNININLLTTLEKDRIFYLMKNSTLSFTAAREKAQQEILNIFFIESAIQPATSLDISLPGADNGILLALSSILQGNLLEAQLTELLATINADIKEDGVLNNYNVYKTLLENAMALDTLKIKTNLTARYNQIGVTSQIPAFGVYIDSFLLKASRLTTGSDFLYPQWGTFGRNILDLNDSIYHNFGYVCLAVRLLNPTDRFKVKMTALNIPDSAYMSYLTDTGFIFPQLTSTGYSFSITPTFKDLYNEERLIITQAAPSQDVYIKLEYFENDFIVPKRTRTIRIGYQ